MKTYKNAVDRLKKKYYKLLVDHYPRRILDGIWMREFGYTVNWNNPRDLNEKIEWLICYGDTSIWPILADKYKVREYVTNRGYSHILPKLYGVWDDAEQIDYEALPDKFVLKCNHDSGSYHLINKSLPFDKDAINKDLGNHLKRLYGYKHCEPHYNKIRPLIIAEELLESKTDTYSFSITDYKVWCFDGKPYSILVCFNRNHHSIDASLYDLNWQEHPEHLVFNSNFRNGSGIVQRPKALEKMLKIAGDLSKGLPEARIDFYIVDGSLYFGEITLTNTCGRDHDFTKEYLIELGNQIRL